MIPSRFVMFRLEMKFDSGFIYATLFAILFLITNPNFDLLSSIYFFYSIASLFLLFSICWCLSPWTLFSSIWRSVGASQITRIPSTRFFKFPNLTFSSSFFDSFLVYRSRFMFSLLLLIGYLFSKLFLDLLIWSRPVTLEFDLCP